MAGLVGRRRRRRFRVVTVQARKRLRTQRLALPPAPRLTRRDARTGAKGRRCKAEPLNESDYSLSLWRRPSSARLARCRFFLTSLLSRASATRRRPVEGAPVQRRQKGYRHCACVHPPHPSNGFTTWTRLAFVSLHFVPSFTALVLANRHDQTPWLVWARGLVLPTKLRRPARESS